MEGGVGGLEFEATHSTLIYRYSFTPIATGLAA